MFNLYSFWKTLSDIEKNNFCQKAGIAYGYMESHLIHGRKKPRMETIQALIDASDGQLTHKGLFEFFLKRPVKKKTKIITSNNSNSPINISNSTI